MADDKISRLVDVARMYYQLDYSQQEIAEKLGISRPTVSRLLVQAVQEGIVQIKICDPAEDVLELGKQIKERFQLKHCMVAPIPEYEDELIKEKLGEVSAEYLHNIVQSGDTIAITWGTTLFQLVKKLQPKNVKDVTIVQLNGGVSYSESNTYASDIVNGLASAFHTTPHFLPVPAVVDHILVKQAIVADRHVKRILELGKRANIAIFTVGEPGEQSTLMHAGYFLDNDIEILKSNHTVGDICSRFIGIDGRISHPALNERTIGIELSDLGEKEYGILIAGGNTKIDGIYGALRGRHANVLITDQYTAKALLDMG
ncbi:transcriptional regulator of deoxyribonucleoside metabolism [Neobacillus bataviensis LMG 21833]|uniref:Transcriptional regulator of deoxyribonucleoside metabolism n=1 Tax=Neobacillus bataviensis LMG 21833 TaxID=1117379 RepID=K6DAV6_9BACI|nr:sugar-binding transcriptional regulator [Neobacillus bataviensis]EKN65434.1 transcriptional regulator of deoxyribonucleoside metabolism [Neobacillus bataviensis LMG 21833]